MSGWSIAATAVCALIALSSAWAFIRSFQHERQVARNGVTVTGKVVARVDAGGDGFHIRVAYAADGVIYEMLSDQPRVEEVGMKVDVRYLPGEPRDARLQLGGLERWAGTIATLVGVVIFTGGAITMAILGMRGVF